MRLPIPDPRDLTAALLGLPERVLGLLDDAQGLLGRAEATMGRVDALVERIEGTRRGADQVVRRVDGVVDGVEPLLRRVDGVVDQVEPLVRRLALLLDVLEPPLTTLEPTLRTLADTTSPGEVAALVRMVDHLPELTRRVETELMPIMGTMGSVAPDIRDLLDVSRELNEMLGKLPGMGRIKKRVDEEQEQEDREG